VKNRDVLSKALDVLELLENNIARELRSANHPDEIRRLAVELGAVTAAKAALETV
jgi:hypothetical protein